MNLNKLMLVILGTFYGLMAQNLSPVSAGFDFSMSLAPDSSLWTWGNNNNNQLGDNGSAIHRSPERIDPSKWIAVFGGPSHAFAIKSDRTLWGWGSNYYAPLGDGSRNNDSTPKKLNPYQWISIATGIKHSIGIQVDSTLWAWGGNSYGQVGDSNNLDTLAPACLAKSKWLKVAANSYHSLAIRADSTLWSWGDNTSAQLGLGNDSAYRNHPVQVLDSTYKWLQVSTGSLHVVALNSDSTLWVWGGNHNGQLGLGDTNPRYSPTHLDSLKWIMVSGGNCFSLALAPDSTLWAWGYNSNGQLGDGTILSHNSPVQVSQEKWLYISAGYAHSMGVKADGSVWAWGLNYFGELGFAPSGGINQSPNPVLVAFDTATITTVDSNQSAQVLLYSAPVGQIRIYNPQGRLIANLQAREDVIPSTMASLAPGKYWIQSSQGIKAWVNP